MPKYEAANFYGYHVVFSAVRLFPAQDIFIFKLCIRLRDYR